jgi:hypothetical protein
LFDAHRHSASHLSLPFFSRSPFIFSLILVYYYYYIIMIIFVITATIAIVAILLLSLLSSSSSLSSSLQFNIIPTEAQSQRADRISTIKAPNPAKGFMVWHTALMNALVEDRDRFLANRLLLHDDTSLSKYRRLDICASYSCLTTGDYHRNVLKCF